MIGVFGGTFDPIHFGHLRTAVEVKDQLGLQEVRLVPCGQPPHRLQPVADADLRLRMLDLAIADEPGIIVDPREMQRTGPSYTVDTLASMREEAGVSTFALIVGMDAFANLPDWHCWERVFELANVVVIHRPGYPPEIPTKIARLAGLRAVHDVQELHSLSCGCVYFHEVIQLEISATAIRRLIEQGQSARYLLPDTVLQVIENQQLYSDNACTVKLN